jgi:FkbM family methyltransferase
MLGLADVNTAPSDDETLKRLSEIERRLGVLEASARTVETTVRDMRRLVGPFAVALPDERLLVHTIHSTLLIVDARDLIITPQLVIYRRWEPELTDVIWNSCRPDTVFVDVGANIGYFTVLAGASIRNGGKGRVIAIEPNPDCLPLLQRNLIINWSMCPIDIHTVAAGEAPGEVWLAYPPERTANAHVSTPGQDVEGERRTRVRIEPLDAIVPEHLAVDILKIDVEGHEISVFRGAEGVISRSPHIKIVMEWSPVQMREAGVPFEEVRSGLERLGLVARKLPPFGSLDNLTPENSALIDIERLSELAYDNILLTRKA